MKLGLLFLTPFLGLVASTPAKYAELGSVKNMFYEMGIADPVTYQLVDRLVELAGVPPEPDVTNSTDLVGPSEFHHVIPSGEVRCHYETKLHYMSVMVAVAKLGQQCEQKKMHGWDEWSASDYYSTTRAFVCSWGKINDCRLNQMLGAVAEIWNHCKKGTIAGWWRSFFWDKAYGINAWERQWCGELM